MSDPGTDASREPPQSRPQDAAPVADGGGRRAWAILGGLLAVYALTFALLFPLGPTNDDEAAYLHQSSRLWSGGIQVALRNPFTEAPLAVAVSHYPVGTALLFSPFSELLGRRAAYVVPLLCLMAGVLITARWIQEAGHSPLFGLIVLGYPSCLVLGRVALSDVPSLAWVSLGLWLFWRGLGRGPGWWLASGFVAGSSLLFRETNVLPFVGFFAGALLRRDRHVWALVVGGLVGVGARLLSGLLVYGNPFFYKQSSAGFFGSEGVLPALAFQALALLVYAPLGLLWLARYRGPRRPELIAGVALFLGVYALFGYAAETSNLASRLVLAPRFYIPLLPIVAFAMAESLPRTLRALRDRLPEARRALAERVAVGVVALWIAGVGFASVGVQVAFHRWAEPQARVRALIESSVGVDAVIVTNFYATRRYLPLLDLRYLPVAREEIRPRDVGTLRRLHPEVYLVLLDRTGSAYRREDHRANQDFLEALGVAPRLETDLELSPTERLRIWRLAGIRGRAR